MFHSARIDLVALTFILGVKVRFSGVKSFKCSQVSLDFVLASKLTVSFTDRKN